MTTYYVDPVNGLDSNNGLGPDASNATNKPWKTINKAIGSGAAIGSGDTVFLGPGTYRETGLTLGATPTAETFVSGDPQNKQGFKDSLGNLVPGGPVIWSAYINGDKATIASAPLFSPNGKNFFTFSKIFFIGGNNSGGAVFQNSGSLHDWNFLDCAFTTGSQSSNRILIRPIVTVDTALNLTFDRCLFFVPGASIGIFSFTVPTSSVADYQLNVLIQNCVMIATGNSISIAGSGANTFGGGGITIRNNTLLGTTIVTSGTLATASDKKTNVYNNLILSNANALGAATLGQIIEDYNIIYSTTARSNVEIGTHSISDGSIAPLLSFGQERLWGGFKRDFLEPLAGSPLLGYGNDGNQTSYDNRNNPRPAGGLSALPAVGALERSNTWGQEATTVRTGTYAISCIGPGYQDFLIPVDTTSTTVSIYLRYDSNYTGTLPKLQLLQNDELGLSATEDTVTAAADTWDQRSLIFTASKKGLVTIRLLSSDTSGYGRALADDFAVA